MPSFFNLVCSLQICLPFCLHYVQEEISYALHANRFFYVHIDLSRIDRLRVKKIFGGGQLTVLYKCSIFLLYSEYIVPGELNRLISLSSLGTNIHPLMLNFINANFNSCLLAIVVGEGVMRSLQ